VSVPLSLVKKELLFQAPDFVLVLQVFITANSLKLQNENTRGSVKDYENSVEL
jgi:hypothetical protein